MECNAFREEVILSSNIECDSHKYENLKFFLFLFVLKLTLRQINKKNHLICVGLVEALAIINVHTVDV